MASLVKDPFHAVFHHLPSCLFVLVRRVAVVIDIWVELAVDGVAIVPPAFVNGDFGAFEASQSCTSGDR